MRNVGDDREMLEEILDLFLKMAPGALAEIHGFFAAGNVLGVRDSVHRLRGCVLLFGENQVARLAERIELQAHAGQLADPEMVRCLDDAVSALRMEAAAEAKRDG